MFQEIRKLNKALDTTDTYNLGGAFYNGGLQYLEMKQYDKAVMRFDSALVYNPNSVEVHNNRGSALAALARHQEAMKEFEKAIFLNPKFMNAYKNMGITFGKMKELPKALECFLKAIELDSTDPMNYRFSGAIYHSLGDDKRAKIYLDKFDSLQGK